MGGDGHRPVFIGHKVHAQSFLPERLPVENRLQRSADQEVAHIDDQHRKANGKHRQRGRPHLDHHQLGRTGKQQQIQGQHLGPAHPLVAAQHSEHAAVGHSTDRKGDIGLHSFDHFFHLDCLRF